MESTDSGVDELTEFAGEVLADSGNLKAISRRPRSNGIRQMDNRFSGVAICPDLEGVLLLDFEEIANLVQNTGNGQVVHALISGPLLAERWRIRLR